MASDDLERVFDLHAAGDTALAAAQVAAVCSAVTILADHPPIGRPTRRGLSELAVARGKSGSLALYRCLPERALGRSLCIRHQRELCYP